MQAQNGRGRNPSGKATGDGTTELLQWGGAILGAGLLSILLLVTVLGGLTIEGAHSNAGWLALIIGAMCLPFGLMLTLLGVAKWFGGRAARRRR